MSVLRPRMKETLALAGAPKEPAHNSRNQGVNGGRVWNMQDEPRMPVWGVGGDELSSLVQLVVTIEFQAQWDLFSLSVRLRNVVGGYIYKEQWSGFSWFCDP